MRKILLGTTAVVGALVMASTGAMAQGADPFRAAGPAMMSHRDLEVRLGGFFRMYYSNTTEDFLNTSAANLGKSDFQEETEIHIVANGKAANGLRYGVAVEIQNDGVRQATSGTNSKTSLDLDEAWGYVAGSFGQLRFGDEDNVYGLMGQGYVANFASGGLDGDFYDSMARTPSLNMQSDAGDNTKVIYMSPQFAGFDFGASFAFNQGEGALSGCTASVTNCDRLASAPGGLIRRRNELTAMLRYRGSFSGVGIGAHVGYMGADAVKNTTGLSPERMNLGLAGIQFTAFGFLVGGQYVFGDGNAGFNPRADLAGDKRQMNSFFTGVSYTYGDFTVGADYAEVRSAGNQSVYATGGNATGSRTEKGFNVGGTYRIAPGIEYIAEYTYIKREEVGFNFASNSVNTTAATRGNNNSMDANIFLTGFRFAF